MCSLIGARKLKSFKENYNEFPEIKDYSNLASFYTSVETACSEKEDVQFFRNIRLPKKSGQFDLKSAQFGFEVPI